MTYHAQHRAAPGSLPPQQPYQPYAIPEAVPPPARPRKSRNHIVLRVAVLAFLAQFPLWFLTFVIPPSGAGTAAAFCAAAASAITGLGCLYGVMYGLYRLVRWAVGIDRR